MDGVGRERGLHHACATRVSFAVRDQIRQDRVWSHQQSRTRPWATTASSPLGAWQGVKLERGLKFISHVPQASDVDSRNLQKNHIRTACAYAGLYRKIWLRPPKGLGGQI